MVSEAIYLLNKKGENKVSHPAQCGKCSAELEKASKMQGAISN